MASETVPDHKTKEHKTMKQMTILIQRMSHEDYPKTINKCTHLFPSLEMAKKHMDELIGEKKAVEDEFQIRFKTVPQDVDIYLVESYHGSFVDVTSNATPRRHNELITCESDARGVLKPTGKHIASTDDVEY